MAEYGINIGVNVQDAKLKSLTRELNELAKVEREIKELRSEGLISAPKAQRLTRATRDQASKLKKETLDLAKAFAQQFNQVSRNNQQLAKYVDELIDARSNFKNAAGDLNTFNDAIEKGKFTIAIRDLKAYRNQVQASADAIQRLSQGVKDINAGSLKVGQTSTFAGFTGIEDLLKFDPGKTNAGLRAYSRTLQDVIETVNRGTDDYTRLFLAIQRVNRELDAVPARDMTMYRAPIGPQPEGRFARARREFGESGFGQRTAGARRVLGSRRARNAIGGGLIGGGFPLLFGQSPTAAIFGGVGGLAGGAMGGQLGFALSILRTAIGEAVEKNAQFNKTLRQMNKEFVLAGSSSKILASDIDKLAERLSITKEEAMALVRQFKFLGSAEMSISAAKLFGDVGTLTTIAGLTKESAADTVKQLVTQNRLTQAQAEQLALDMKGKDLDAQRLAIEKALNQAQATRVRKSREEMSETERRRAARFGKARAARTAGTSELRPAVAESQLGASVGLAETFAAIEAALPKPEKEKKGGVDPTIALMRRLEIVRGQIVVEQELLQLQGQQSKVARMILRHEMAITKARATGAAERKKLKDVGDQELSRLIEEGKIAAANAQFEREARELAEQALKATEDLARPLQDQIDQIKDKAAFEREYAELIRSGVVPAVAQQTVEINKQVKELERLEEKQLREMEIHIANLQILLDKATTDELRVDLQEKLNRALERQNEIERKGAEAREEAREAQKTDKDRLQDAIDLIQGQINNLMDPVQQVISLANTMGNAFAESFKGIINGSMTAREALANLFQRTADHFLDMAARMIAAQIQMQILNIGLSFFGGGGGGAALPGSAPQMTPNAVVTPSGFQGQFAGFAANGGQIQGGKSYIVGEKGPELFTPGASGVVTPNHALGGGTSNIVVNVDAGGTQVQGDAPNASKLGEALGAAVRAELMRQKRPGGLLA